jgi:hypothetical protein
MGEISIHLHIMEKVLALRKMNKRLLVILETGFTKVLLKIKSSMKGTLLNYLMCQNRVRNGTLAGITTLICKLRLLKSSKLMTIQAN